MGKRKQIKKMKARIGKLERWTEAVSDRLNGVGNGNPARERAISAERDGTDRLCSVLYRRDPCANDWMGGSNARMIVDAAKILEAVDYLLSETGACPDSGDGHSLCNLEHCGYCQLARTMAAAEKNGQNF